MLGVLRRASQRGVDMKDGEKYVLNQQTNQQEVTYMSSNKLEEQPAAEYANET